MNLRLPREFCLVLLSSSFATTADFWSDARTLSLLAAAIRAAYYYDRHLRSEQQVSILSAVIGNVLSSYRGMQDDARRELYAPFSIPRRDFLTLQDFAALVEVCESLMIPLAEAVARIGKAERKMARAIAKSYVEVCGHSALTKVTQVWEDFAQGSCVCNAQRDAVARIFSELRKLLFDEYLVPGR